MTPNKFLNNFFQSSKYIYILSHSKYVSTPIFEFFNTPYRACPTLPLPVIAHRPQWCQPTPPHTTTTPTETNSYTTPTPTPHQPHTTPTPPRTTLTPHTNHHQTTLHHHQTNPNPPPPQHHYPNRRCFSLCKKFY